MSILFALWDTVGGFVQDSDELLLTPGPYGRTSEIKIVTNS